MVKEEVVKGNGWVGWVKLAEGGREGGGKDGGERKPGSHSSQRRERRRRRRGNEGGGEGGGSAVETAVAVRGCAAGVRDWREMVRTGFIVEEACETVGGLHGYCRGRYG